MNETGAHAHILGNTHFKHGYFDRARHDLSNGTKNVRFCKFLRHFDRFLVVSPEVYELADSVVVFELW